MTRDFSREQRGRVSVLTNGGHAAGPRGTVFGGGYAKTGGRGVIKSMVIARRTILQISRGAIKTLYDQGSRLLSRLRLTKPAFYASSTFYAFYAAMNVPSPVHPRGFSSSKSAPLREIPCRTDFYREEIGRDTLRMHSGGDRFGVNEVIDPLTSQNVPTPRESLINSDRDARFPEICGFA